MASDPLSSTTHKARAYLLGLSAAGLLTHYYGLTVEDIPLAGLKIDVTENLVPLALTVGIGYFLISFVVYALDDAINLANTPYQDRIEASVTRLLDYVRDDTVTQIQDFLKNSDITHTTEERKALAREIWERASLIFGITEEEFKRTVEGMLEVDFNLRRDPNKKGRLYPDGNAFRETVKALEAAHHAIKYHRRERYRGSRGYSRYRWFRVWIFDLALPPIVGVAALAIMWRHLLPF